VQSTQVIWSEPAGHKLSPRFVWHVPVLSQHPRQLSMVHPPDEHCPLWHVPPLVVQSWHAAPPVPHCLSVGDCTHVPLLQQPSGQLDALHAPLPELLVLQAPPLQVSPAVEQFAQMPPPVPHCVSDVLVTQTLPLQHPAHVCGPHDAEVSGTPASSAPPPELLYELPLPFPDAPPPLDELLPLVGPRPPDDEPLLTDDPPDELPVEGPPSSPPRSAP
jgi:hypothetical protein